MAIKLSLTLAVRDPNDRSARHEYSRLRVPPQAATKGTGPANLPHRGSRWRSDPRTCEENYPCGLELRISGVERGDSQFSEIDHSKPVKAGSVHVCASIRRKCKTPSRVSTETNVWTDALQRVRQKLAGRIFLACQWDCRLVEVRSLSEDSETSSLPKWRVILILARCTAVWSNCSLVSSCVKPKAQLRTAFGVARIEMMPWQTEF